MNQTQINPIAEVTTKVARLKPKRRSCSRCLSEAKQKLNRLCASCEGYVDQDKVSLTETLMSGEVLEDRAEEAWDEVSEVFRDYTAEKQMVWPLLKKIGLSKQQRQVFFLHVCGQLTFEAISKCLRVSITTAKTQFQRFREKLRFCSPESQLVNTSSETSLIKIEAHAPPIKERPSKKPKPLAPAIQSNLYLDSRCPRCRSKGFGHGLDYRYCMDCLYSWP